jgi:hypothetical protein
LGLAFRVGDALEGLGVPDVDAPSLHLYAEKGTKE